MMLRSATLFLFALTASTTNARINQANKNNDEANDETKTKMAKALAAHRHLRPLQRQNRAAILGRFANNGGGRLGGGGGNGAGNLLDSFLGANSNGDGGNNFLGGGGRLPEFLDSLLIENEFPPDLLNGGGADGDLSGMIVQLMETIMTMLQDGGGNGLLNPENNLQTIMSEWLENLQMADIGCGAQAQDQSSLPECSWNLQGDPGVWVCRSMYNPETGVRESVNTCAHPQLSFVNLDQCGACPLETTNAPAIVECTCSCTTNSGEPGVGMTVLGMMERCYPAGIVNSAVNTMPELVQCAAC